MDFPTNTTARDRAFRVVLGLLMLIIGWGSGAYWSLALRVFALFPLITGIAGWCPVYALLRIGTRREPR